MVELPLVKGMFEGISIGVTHVYRYKKFGVYAA